MDDTANIERCIERSLDEMERILAAASLEHERCGDESHDHFVVRKVLEASGLPDQLRGAVEALAHDYLREAIYLDDDLLANLDARVARTGTDRAGYLRWMLTGEAPTAGKSK